MRLWFKCRALAQCLANVAKYDILVGGLPRAYKIFGINTQKIPSHLHDVNTKSLRTL